MKSRHFFKKKTTIITTKKIQPHKFSRFSRYLKKIQHLCSQSESPKILSFLNSSEENHFEKILWQVKLFFRRRIKKSLKNPAEYFLLLTKYFFPRPFSIQKKTKIYQHEGKLEFRKSKKLIEFPSWNEKNIWNETWKVFLFFENFFWIFLLKKRIFLLTSALNCYFLQKFPDRKFIFSFFRARDLLFSFFINFLKLLFYFYDW